MGYRVILKRHHSGTYIEANALWQMTKRVDMYLDVYTATLMFETKSGYLEANREKNCF